MTLHDLAPTQPFSFSQTTAFLASFPPCRGDYIVEPERITIALAANNRAVPVTIRPRGIEAPSEALANQARDFIGAGDDLGPLYRAAKGDAPFERVIDGLRGLHHVRFLTLEEISVYCVMMQRAPVNVAAALKRRFLDRFGLRVKVEGQELRAMPAFSELVKLDGDNIAEAIGHSRKGAVIADVIRGVAAIGETFLRTAPYEQARDTLLAIKGVGPFSAAAILLRGLGRMDELPWMDQFDHAGNQVYGAAFERRAIEQRYSRSIGYWAYYCMNASAGTPARAATPKGVAQKKSSRVGELATVARRGRPSMSSTVAR